MSDVELFKEPEYESTSNSGVVVAQLPTVADRLDHIEAQNAVIIDRLNVIGTMLNGFAEGFDGVMKMVESGGIGSLLGGMMGRKNG